MDWGDMNEESIYNLIPKETPKKEASVKYKSRFNQTPNDVENNIENKVLDDLRAKELQNSYTNKKQYKTMGPAKVALRRPDEFLKSKEKCFVPPQGGPFKYKDENRKAQVPKITEKPVMGMKRDVNFITENAMKIIKTAPKVPKKNLVDSRNGSKQNLEESGLEPNFVFKKEYGKTPEYLKKRKEEMARNEEYMKAYIEKQKRDGQNQVMPEEDRLKIIKGLKENWDLAYKEYLSLPMVIDTPTKKNYKERLEATMKQLEADVQLLESHKTIYVNDF